MSAWKQAIGKIPEISMTENYVLLYTHSTNACRADKCWQIISFTPNQ